MTVREAIEQFGWEVLTLPEPDREIRGGYCGDLLSWVMTRLRPDMAWVTIMNNINIVAVASLADAACILLAEGAEIDEACLARAKTEGVNILRSQDGAFSICARLGTLFHV